MIKIIKQDIDWQHIFDEQLYDAFIYGGKRAVDAEERCSIPYKKFTSIPNIVSLGLSRTKVDIAKQSNQEWMSKIPKQNIHSVPAHDPIAARDFFKKQLQIYSHIDVIPLGPKPMLLGFLLFYWPLSESQKENVRILYDFPTPKIGCTTGSSHGYWFDMQELLNHNL